MLDKVALDPRCAPANDQTDNGSSRRDPTLQDWPAGAPRIDSRALLNGSRELRIRHGDAEYRLRETRAGKLILTK